MSRETNIEIHTYDFLLDNARGRMGWVTHNRKNMAARRTARAVHPEEVLRDIQEQMRRGPPAPSRRRRR
jgi:hypothetical protein